MKIYSHRGNLDGTNISKENNPDHLLNVISQGFDVEVDIWRIDDKIYLGHDNPEYIVDERYIDTISPNSLFHAKNVDALNWLMDRQHHYFWHQRDEYTMSSKGIVIVYPGITPPQHGSIIALPEIYDQNPYESNCSGIITDYPNRYHLSNSSQPHPETSKLE